MTNKPERRSAFELEAGLIDDVPMLRPPVRAANWSDRLCELRDKYLQKCLEEFEWNVRTFAQSPIEELFIGAMMAAYWVRPLTGKHGLGVPFQAYPDLGDWRGVLVSQSSIAFTQIETRVGGSHFRIDVAIIAHGMRFAIELDGHEFHERTKEQARRDRARERALVGAGWRAVIRFTGSEIHADAGACLRQVEKIIDDIGKATRDTPPSPDGDGSEPQAVVQ